MERYPINIWAKVSLSHLIQMLKRYLIQIRTMFLHQGEPSPNKVGLG
jgi:hypothetical protein